MIINVDLKPSGIGRITYCSFPCLFFAEPSHRLFQYDAVGSEYNSFVVGFVCNIVEWLPSYPMKYVYNPHPHY